MSQKKPIICVGLLLLLFLLNNSLVQAQDADLQEQLRLRLWALLDTSNTTKLVIESEQLHQKNDLKKFYEQRGYRPAWIEDYLVPIAAKQFSACTARTDDNGLIPNDYHYDALTQLIALAEVGGTEVTVNN